MDERATLTVRGLQASVEGKQILHGVDLEVPQGEIHALMGPNGSGKSTLAYTLMGHPKYAVTGGEATFDGRDLLSLPPDERARLGIFLSFQYPTAIPGVTTVNFLRAALRAQGRELPARQFLGTLKSEMEELRFDESFGRRYINDGFSGGEKKRAEILQMAMFHPRLAILDETDSGLDVDALRTVATAVLRLSGRETGAADGGVVGNGVSPPMGILVITHYPRILEFLTPDRVHVMSAGRIVTSGGHDLAHEIEAGGYDPILAGPAGVPATPATTGGEQP